MGGGWWAGVGRGGGLCCAAWFEMSTSLSISIFSLLASRSNNIVRSGQIMQLHQEDGEDAAAVKQNPS